MSDTIGDLGKALLSAATSGPIATRDHGNSANPQTTVDFSTIRADENSVAIAAMNLSSGAGSVTANVGPVNHYVNHTYHITPDNLAAAPPAFTSSLFKAPTPSPPELCADVNDEIDALSESQRETFMTAMRLYDAGSIAEAIKFLTNSEYREQALAQRILGHCEIARDYKPTAFGCFKRSAEKGDSKAQFYVGWCFSHRFGTKLDNRSAFLWYTKSVRQGNPHAIEALCNVQWIEHIYDAIADDTVTYLTFALLRTVFESRASDDLINNIKESASGGDIRAQNLLMWLNILGVSIGSETVDTLKWLVESAVNGNKLAQLNLQERIVPLLAIDDICSDQNTYDYYRRMPMPTNAILSNSQVSEDNEKIFYLLVSHATDSAYSQRLLGTCYAYGIGTEQDNDQAFDLFSQAAEDGDKLAMQILEQWDEKKAARAGDVDAAYRLYWRYKQGDEVEMDLNKAFRWVLLAANGDNPEAQNALGGCYARGEGTEIDSSMAAIYYQKSASRSAHAMNNLGKAYEEGNGIEQNFYKAFECYQKAATMGHTNAQVSLGNCYTEGRGTHIDYRSAHEWYKKAALAGDPSGMFYLAESFKHGRHGNIDLFEAKRWHMKAMELGDPRAVGQLEKPFLKYLDYGERLIRHFTKGRVIPGLEFLAPAEDKTPDLL